MTVKSSRVTGVICAGLLILAQLTGVQLAYAKADNLGTHKFWTAWKGTDANGVICYVSSQPQDSQPTNVNRDPIHFLVIHRKGLGTRNEVQTLVGYPMDPNGKPSVTVDGKTYPMLPDGSAAWLSSREDEKPLVEAMKKGSNMVVKGLSKRGTNTTDTYSLSGITAALDQLDKGC